MERQILFSRVFLTLLNSQKMFLEFQAIGLYLKIGYGALVFEVSV